MAEDNRWNDRDRDWRDDRSWWEGRERGRGSGRDYGRYGTRPGYGESLGGVGGGNDPGLEAQARYGDYDPERGREEFGYRRYAGDYRPYGEHGRHRHRGHRGGEERSWMGRAGDRVSAFFGDDEAEARIRQREMMRGEHRGRGPKGYRRSDDRIREDVNDRLTDDAWLDASGIDVQVSDAEVTLTGTVKSRADKRRAENLAEAISGVTNVQNNLRVQASETESMTSTFGSIPPG